MAARILFCTSNGTGLGHLTRSMAIAKRLPEDVMPVFFTLSQALPVVRELGFHAEFLFSAGYAGTDRADWNLLYDRRLGEIIDTYQPQVVSFDGTYPYLGLFAQMARHRQRSFVWCRRAMWRAGLGADSLSRSGLFDLVVEPGEFAAEADQGLTRAWRDTAVVVPPVVLCDDDELLDRAAARAELGLRAEDPAVLVQLGAGNINDLSSTVGICVEGLRAAGGLQVAFAESTISTRRTALPPDVVRLRTYPLARYAHAFDFAVTAAGYNSYHELLAAGVPCIFAPNLDTQLDDQAARARYAEAVGVGRNWEQPTAEAFRSCLEPMLDDGARAAMAAAARALPRPSGAQAAAAALTRLLPGGSA